MKKGNSSYSHKVRPEKPLTLKNLIYGLWVQNPHLTASKICQILRKEQKDWHVYYQNHGGYINKLLSEFRSYPKLGSPQRPLNPSLHRRVFVWEFLSRDYYLKENGGGWQDVDNQNGMMVFRHEHLGSVHWYKGGKVILYLRGELSLNHVKELFCEAYRSVLPHKVLMKYVEADLRFNETERHWVFDLGVPIPRFEIPHFVRSHGMGIGADGSHPTGIEIRESKPFWIGEVYGTLELFAEQIKSHLELIETWKKEAETRAKHNGDSV